MSPQIHPSGFRISMRPVSASFAHPYSFQLAPPNAIQDEYCINASAAVGGSEGQWAKYWDENALVEQMAFEVEEPVAEKGKEKAKKKKGGDDQCAWSLSLVTLGTHIRGPHSVKSVSILATPAATALPSTLAPVSLSFKGARIGEAGEKRLGPKVTLGTSGMVYRLSMEAALTVTR